MKLKQIVPEKWFVKAVVKLLLALDSPLSNHPELPAAQKKTAAALYPLVKMKVHSYSKNRFFPSGLLTTETAPAIVLRHHIPLH